MDNIIFTTRFLSGSENMLASEGLDEDIPAEIEITYDDGEI